ncbi:MAG TPA: RelA/SpoT family protein [Ktedonobacteraceae bacterium]|nr:RelA/SpoT family protein [Ktedonobacteraceae bacterium]
MSPTDVDFISQALQMAEETSRGAPGRPSQILPPFEHALVVATILAEMHIDAIGVAAGLVFEAVDGGLLELERVQMELGFVVSRIVDSMSRLNILERKKKSMEQVTLASQIEAEGNREQKKRRIRDAMRKQQAETVRKMFLGMADDPRVVILKLAYRLNIMRMIRSASAEQLDPQEKMQLAEETRDIYAPLAGRLGMSRVESELEDLAFAVIEPDIHAWLLEQVEAESIHWRSYVNRVCGILREEMANLGLKAEVSGRVKHIYSFYKKLRRTSGDVETLQDLKETADFSQIHDLIAFRILLPTNSDCYVALGHVHSLWRPKEGRIKDFIANPKSNGYSALHTTVFCMDNQLVEIQIRTFEMHEMAEYGVAMHWHYKDVGDTASASAKELLAWLRQLADWQRELRSSASPTRENEIVEAMREDIVDEQIFVFTPKGEVRDLPVGSTPLDFAYRIHSAVGDKCAGARVTSESRNGDSDRLVTRMVPLDYELRSGDIVDIITNRTAHPTRDWLNFARTSAARSKIRRYLKVHERDINIQIGRERLERDLKLAGSRGFDPLASEETQEWLAHEFRMESFEDLLSAIGIDKIRPHSVSVKLAERWPQLRDIRETKESKDALRETEELPAMAPTTKPASSSARLEVAGVSGLLTRLANCCCPLPGDEIVGFISRGKGVIIHRADCRNIARYRERQRERLITVGWTTMSQQRYKASIVIHATDRAGLIRDIATVVSEAGVNMASVATTVIKEQATVSAQLEVDSLDQMERLFSKIKRVRGVTQVERDLGKKKN